MEKLEKKLLEKDRDIRIKFIDDENKIKESEKFNEENFETLIQKSINEYYASEEYKSKNIQDEEIKEHEDEMQRSRYLSEIILKGKMKNFIMKEEFEFVEYTQIFQSLLYFAHIDPLIINEKETNKLEWKKARKEWRNIFPYILSYNPIGPKPEEVKGIYKLNKIQDNLKSAIEKRDEVQKYSFALLQLVDYILLVIKIRFCNIEQRYNTIKQLKQERDYNSLKPNNEN